VSGTSGALDCVALAHLGQVVKLARIGKAWKAQAQRLRNDAASSAAQV
jgi:hypothetical protein